MGSFVSWIDFSKSERERMRRAIALFQESETVDELGLGTIRDLFSDALFPGTSTIQTRLGYFLFVPWIYQALERKGVGAEKVRKAARKRELGLIEPLLASENHDGTFGSSAGELLKRLPSSVYWAGMRQWGIAWYQGSLEQYHSAFDTIRVRRRTALQADDEGVAAEGFPTWHPRLPAAPEEFPEGLSFRLRPEDAAFLQGRMSTDGCKGTLLAHLAVHGRSTDAPSPWRSPDLAGAPKGVLSDLDLARRFSILVHGASLIYNLLLAELRQSSELVDSYRERLASWADHPEMEDHGRFELEALWTFVRRQEGRIPIRTQGFVTRWAQRVWEIGPEKIPDDEQARAEIRDREQSLKKSRSRFSNQRALDQWGGASGTQRLVFRWPTVRRFLSDLHVGLGTGE